MVLVAFVHVDSTVHVWLQPFRVVTQCTTLAQVVVHTVAFDIGFVIDIDTQFVAKVIELVALRIVAEANSVQVVLLHQFEVLTHQFFGYIVAGFGIMFVDVHPFQLDGLSVDEETYVWFAIFALFIDFLDFETTETYAIRNHFCHLVAFLQRDEELVEVRMFRSPGLYVRDFGFKTHVGLVLVSLSYNLALCIQQFIRNAGRRLCVLHGYSQFEDTILVGVIQSRYYLEVTDVSLRLREQEHVAFDTADAPEVLTFQISTGTPTENFQYERVLAFF